MKKKIKYNLYAVSDVAAALSLFAIYLFISTKDNEWRYVFASMAAIYLICFVTQPVFGDTKIENRSGEPVPVKPEDDITPLTVEPGGVMYGIDGLRTPRGRVYKVCDGCHAVVHDDGSVSVKSLTGRFINYASGGYLDKSPDSGWDRLFET